MHTNICGFGSLSNECRSQECESSYQVNIKCYFSPNLPPLGLARGAWLWRIAWVAWSRLLLRRISLTLARVTLGRLLLGVALGRLLRVTLRRVPLLWRRLVVLLLRVALCLRRLLIAVGIVTHGHWCVGLVGHW